jgi:ABC-type multidrug transport system ATPase subunit
VTEADTPAVRTWNLRRRFGSFDALDGVDLAIEQGETVALFGSNGAGKTTLLNVLGGLLRATEGRIEVFGVALPGGPPSRRRVGIVSHETFLYRDLTATENLRYYGRLYGVSGTQRAARLIERLGLTAVADRAVRTYSRGMLQRLSLARALLHEPELLLLDEPFIALDPSASAVVERLIGDLRDDGVTVLFSTHDLEGGIRLAGRALMMDRGRIVWDSRGERPTLAVARAVYAQIVVRV